MEQRKTEQRMEEGTENGIHTTAPLFEMLKVFKKPIKEVKVERDQAQDRQFDKPYRKEARLPVGLLLFGFLF
ncbi:hypothetical protein [Sulfidibacter corallicola]|uniref:Uncharacterized protein n=1 Tax=Sulfidibacter corallicola TaxID=2818388 RepID=A0A8A4TIW8_SULCO|nr:hypothetical protein [Sulfidibacter corallicola]QTD49866.1 hypothetical protein J3U87_30155 [Sulfidibacter corallicola]